MNKFALIVVAGLFACNALAAGAVVTRMEVASVYMDNMIVPRDCE